MFSETRYAFIITFGPSFAYNRGVVWLFTYNHIQIEKVNYQRLVSISSKLVILSLIIISLF